MKLLITQDTFAPSIDGAAFLAANTFVDLETDSARAIVTAGKGLYVDAKDDNSKIKQNTASDARVKAVIEALEAAKAAETPAKAGKA